MTSRPPAIRIRSVIEQTLTADAIVPLADTIRASIDDVSDPDQPCFGGKLLVHRMRAAHVHDTTPFTIAEQYSHSLGDVASELVGGGFRLGPSLEADLGGPIANPGDVLYIDYIGLTPALRGQGIGRQIIDYLINAYGHGMGVCVVSTRPLQHDPIRARASYDSRLELDLLPAGVSVCEDRIARYAHRLGFVPLADDRFMARRIDRPAQGDAPDLSQTLRPEGGAPALG